MEIGKTLTVTDRDAWREWLAEHHASEPEVWLVYAKKATGQPRIPYDEAVEEALCFGWIDSIQKALDDDRTAQRFSPRRRGSAWSQLNKERARKLLATGRMAPAGLAALGDALAGSGEDDEIAVPPDILAELRRDPEVWRNYRGFPPSYRRIRIAWIDGARSRPDEFEKRLRHFLRMTAQNRTYGTMP
jgi:uncharacterized protein YdeI (YjbR/CyaY-like superfamily)